MKNNKKRPAGRTSNRGQKVGHTGNPFGRPKLGDSAAESARKILECEDITKFEPKTVNDRIMLALSLKALEGDVRSAESVMERGYNKPIQKTEVEDVTKPKFEDVFQFYIEDTRPKKIE